MRSFDRATCVAAGDTLVVYGRDDAVSALPRRPPGDEGDREHEAAVARHRAQASHERADDAQEAGGAGQP